MQKKSTDINQAFAILGVGPGSPADQVRHAYRRLVKRWHPDQFAHNPGARADAEARLKIINQAYAVIKVYFKNHPGPATADPRKENGHHPPESDPARRFGSPFHFAGRIRTPPQPDPQPRATPRPSPQPSAGGFQEALKAASGGHKTFQQSPQSPVPPSGPTRASQRVRPPYRGRSRSTRIEPVERISRVGPVAPIDRIGDD